MDPSMHGKAEAPGRAQKLKSESKDRRNTYWSSFSGWKHADVADTFLLGAEEGGFAGLEILDDPNIIQAAIGPSQEATTTKRKQKQQGKAASVEGGPASGGIQEEAGEIANLADGKAGQKGKRKKRQQREGGEEQQESKKDGEQEGKTRRKQRKEDKEANGGGNELAGSMNALLERVRELEGEVQVLRAEKAQDQGVVAAATGVSANQPVIQPPRGAPSPAAEGPVADTSAWPPYLLHGSILEALGRAGFAEPTPIQQACLPAAIRDKRDIIGAAQTGSGKTLAFALPILNHLVNEREQLAAGGLADKQQQGPLRALILTPTRELALQVCSHIQALGRMCWVRCEAIVGGLALVKQERLLRACPPVIVATPGRLWELMAGGQPHVSQLQQLTFFVLDEADRMVQQGHFQELSHILDLLPQPGKGQLAPQEEEDEDNFDYAKASKSMKRVNRKLGRSRGMAGHHRNDDATAKGREAGEGNHLEDGVEEGKHGMQGQSRGDKRPDGRKSDGQGDRQEDKVQHDNNTSKQRRGESAGHQGDNAADRGHEGKLSEGREHGGAGVSEGEDGKADPNPSVGTTHPKRVALQTFVFSATLTLPASLRKRMKKKLGGAGGSASLELLMDRIRFRGRPAVVDLTPSNKLAESIQEAQVQCLDEERESLLYYLLACHPGRTIVFANAVSAIRRLAALLRTLGLPASALHAQQQQRQRLKALDVFRSRPDGVLVATDVAARGLDVKDVVTVVHFQLPPSVDTYIHRCGRTARMRADGVSIALVTPKEAPRFALLCQALGHAPPPAFPVDQSVLGQADKRWRLALKIDSIEHQVKKSTADRTWAKKTAALVELDVSNDELGSDDQVDDDKIRGLERHNAAQRVGQLNSAAAKKLRMQLAQLLAKPLQPKIHHSFFTGGATLFSLQCATRQAHDAPGVPANDSDAQLPSTLSPTEVTPPALLSSSMTKTLALANQLAAAKQSFIKKMQKKGKVNGGGTNKGSNKYRKAQQNPQAARLALARELLKKKATRKGHKGQQAAAQGGMVVLQGMGRNVNGPNAMQVLRQQMGE